MKALVFMIFIKHSAVVSGGCEQKGTADGSRSLLCELNPIHSPTRVVHLLLAQ